MTSNLKENGLFYTDHGEGETCVLLHGFLENNGFWASVIDALRNQYRFIVIDLPGHGESDVLEKGAQMTDYAHAVKKTLDALHIDKVNLIGHSMGGYVGLAFAKAFPSQTIGLLLLNSSPKPDTAERIENRKHGITVAEKNYPAIVRMSVANLFTKAYRSGHGDEIAEAQGEALKTPLEGYIAGQNAMMRRPDLTKFWKRADFKRMMILGEDDTLIDAGAMRSEFQDNDVKIITIFGGHISLMENPSGVIAGIKEFLS